MFNIKYLRSFKILDYAIFDLAASFIGIYLLSPLLTKLFSLIHLNIPRASWIYFTIPLGIVFHIIFGNYTPMTKYFLDPTGHYLLKLFIITLIILGVRGITIIK
jgi:hypothetical protein